jgi:hypothetical protein
MTSTLLVALFVLVATRSVVETGGSSAARRA